MKRNDRKRCRANFIHVAENVFVVARERQRNNIPTIYLCMYNVRCKRRFKLYRLHEHIYALYSYLQTTYLKIIARVLPQGLYSDGLAAQVHSLPRQLLFLCKIYNAR